MEIVQIDHTLVDLFVVDAVNRQPLQRPWLTLAIDIASRMVAGFYLSLEHPSSTSVALAIRHMVLPKTPWLAEQKVSGDWPVYGLPTAIHLDNAREFRGKALVWGAAEHGINLIHRPVARPHYGGHIERLIGTMMGAVHFLPGSTSSDVASRGDYDPQKHAVMTFDELEQWLALEIVGRYHADIHRALKIPPRLAWEDALRVVSLYGSHTTNTVSSWIFYRSRNGSSAETDFTCSVSNIGTMSSAHGQVRRTRCGSVTILEIFHACSSMGQPAKAGRFGLRTLADRGSRLGSIDRPWPL